MRTYKIEGPLAMDLARGLEALKERQAAEEKALVERHQEEANGLFAACQAAAGIANPEDGDWYLDSSYVAGHKLLFLVKREEKQNLSDLLGNIGVEYTGGTKTGKLN
ncbi:hypothetical protein P67b_00063 [Ruegeria phage Tedan]|nr:hypothetical protein P67b_00063 [Ruegeria phage Tedan]